VWLQVRRLPWPRIRNASVHLIIFTFLQLSDWIAIAVIELKGGSKPNQLPQSSSLATGKFQSQCKLEWHSLGCKITGFAIGI